MDRSGKFSDASFHLGKFSVDRKGKFSNSSFHLFFGALLLKTNKMNITTKKILLLRNNLEKEKKKYEKSMWVRRPIKSSVTKSTTKLLFFLAAVL